MRFLQTDTTEIKHRIGKLVTNAEKKKSLLSDLRNFEIFSKNILEILDLIPTGIILIDGDLKPTLINRYADDVLNDKDGLYLSNGQITVSHANTMRDLKTAIVQATATSEMKSSVLSVGRPSGEQALMMLLVPLSEQDVVVFVADPVRKPQVQKSLIADLFGLTKMESAVAASVAQGQRLNEVAQNLNISLNTARSHLKHVFSKTGTDRQLELANHIGALLGKVWLEEEIKANIDPPAINSGHDKRKQNPNA